uniref:Uncharacterized protein n=1 Tax=Anopheles maculatus TaxID=74869 RepID=A0A182SLC7_9DIPT
MPPGEDDRDRIITTGGGGEGGQRRWRSDSGSGGPLPAIGPSSFRAGVSSGNGGGNNSTATATADAASAHQNAINHQRAGSGGYAGPSHGDADNPISAKLNLTTSPSSERRRKKTNKQRIRKREDTHRPTVDATKLLQR